MGKSFQLMVIPNSALIEAINQRISTRKYLFSPISIEEKTKIQRFIDTFPFSHQVKITFHELFQNESVFYFPGPPYFAAMMSPESLIDQTKLGFIGEILILACTHLKYSTCWYGHYKKSAVQKIVQIRDNIPHQGKIFCITPIGYPTIKTSFTDKMANWVWKRNQKTFQSRLNKDSETQIPLEYQECLNLAMRAPSAMNSQRWEFKYKSGISNDIIEISKEKGFKHIKWAYYDIDVGTAAAHIWLGMIQKQMKVNVDILDDQDRAIWVFNIQK